MGSKLFTGLALAASMFLSTPAMAAAQKAQQGQSISARLVSRAVKVPTNKKVKDMIAEMKDSQLNYVKHKGDEKGDTPPLEVVALTKGVKLKVPKGHKPDYDNYSNPGKHTIYEISGVPASGLVELTALMPASGHVNETVGGKLLSKNDTARYYAKTNVYNMEIEHPDGSVDKINGIKADSQLIKAHELGIKLTPGSTFVKFYPTASGGIGGNYNGRVVELRWAGK